MNCWWILFHKWKQWQDVIFKVNMLDFRGQTRYCEKCNKKQSRYVNVE